MVPCLHQNTVYIKSKLRVWRVQKCIPLVGAETSLTCAGLQTRPSQVSQYRSENGNLRKSWSSFCHGTVFTPKQYLYQNKLRVWRVQKCIPVIGAKTSLTCGGLQTTPSHVSEFTAENGNLRKSGSTLSHGTVFVPKQCLYPEEGTGMDSPKMYSSHRCKNLTYLCGTANDPISCKPV